MAGLVHNFTGGESGNTTPKQDTIFTATFPVIITSYKMAVNYQKLNDTGDRLQWVLVTVNDGEDVGLLSPVAPSTAAPFYRPEQQLIEFGIIGSSDSQIVWTERFERDTRIPLSTGDSIRVGMVAESNGATRFNYIIELHMFA